MLEEEIEKSGKLKLELMQLKQTVKEKNRLQGMLDKAKNNDFLMKSAIQEALRISQDALSDSHDFDMIGRMRLMKDILNKCNEATKKEMIT